MHERALKIVLSSLFSRGSRLRVRGRLVECISDIHAIRQLIRLKQALQESSYRKGIKDPTSPLSLFYISFSASRR